ncbi:NitT/TauT family transport system ATP-binding protein [Amaricoccus macauensis]|uniref:NitT/TauT family transport system ATP-binding protein n=1 Tax=Amaricoccus macauensis TaxID=57001 RepID=A0A840SWM3_9RHOB|nr:ABC transporter ATP-binding protein [Amaricoccus macauensis]MBB5224206.1 NitT/TauT family transport system ATP-binding protein [Amaricoccus macauensis]
MQTRGNSIAFDKVSRIYRRAGQPNFRAVDNVSLTIAAGEFVCIVGPSGCGKSTLMQICAGLVTPSDGTVLVGSTPVTGPGADRGVVFQQDSVFPWMSVIDNVEYGLKCRGVPARERREIAREYLARVGLGMVETSWPKELSGGMRKRVAIAGVFANGSGVLLLDEPFGALDYVTRHQLHDVLLGLWDDGTSSPRTILFVTHDVDEALTLGDRILVMGSGRVVDDIAVRAARPRTPDALLDRDMVEIRHTLLRHLGLEGPRARAPELVAAGR